MDKLTEHLSPQPPIQPNTNLIHYAVDPNYAFMHLLRSDSPYGPFKEIDVFDPVKMGGLYLDRNLTNDQTYYYILEGTTLSGAASAPSDIFSGTPKADPYQPIGSVVIQRGAAFVATNMVELTLNVDASALTVIGEEKNAASEVLVSNQPDFANAVWQKYTQTLIWTLAPVKGGLAVVYVKYRDAAGNESNVYSDDIHVKAPGSLGVIHGRFALKLPLTVFGLRAADVVLKPGVTITILNDSLYGPAFTALTGDGVLDNLLPGTYDLKIEYPGYIPLILKGVTVSAGNTSELGNLTLNPLLWIRVPFISK